MDIDYELNEAYQTGWEEGYRAGYEAGQRDAELNIYREDYKEDFEEVYGHNLKFWIYYSGGIGRRIETYDVGVRQTI